MGLTIAVGMLSDHLKCDPEIAEDLIADLSKLDSILLSAGLDRHYEPIDCTPLRIQTYGYIGIHPLRRVAAHLNYRGQFPGPNDDDPCLDPLLLRYDNLSEHHRSFEHLMLHSPSSGFFVPQDFDDIILCDEAFRLGTSNICSTVRLVEELELLAKHLEAPIRMDPESDSFKNARHSKRTYPWAEYWLESYCCLSLLKAAKYAVSKNALLYFC